MVLLRQCGIKLPYYETEQSVKKYEAIAQRLQPLIPDTRIHPLMLSQLTGSFLLLMDATCGRQAPEPRAPCKLPNALFQNFAVDGPVCVVLHKLLQFTQRTGLQIAQLAEQREKALDLMKQIHAELKSKGLLKLPKVYLHPSIVPENVPNLQRVVIKCGGSLADSEDEPGVTHIVHKDSASVLEESDVEYCRTLEVKGSQALVHWWYFPDSYDEWISTEHIDGDAEADEQGQGAWRVHERWLRDSALFNEWSNPVDYQLEEDTRPGDKRPREDSLSAPDKKARVEAKAAAGPPQGLVLPQLGTGEGSDPAAPEVAPGRGHALQIANYRVTKQVVMRAHQSVVILAASTNGQAPDHHKKTLSEKRATPAIENLSQGQQHVPPGGAANLTPHWDKPLPASDPAPPAVPPPTEAAPAAGEGAPDSKGPSSPAKETPPAAEGVPSATERAPPDGEGGSAEGGEAAGDAGTAMEGVEGGPAEAAAPGAASTAAAPAAVPAQPALSPAPAQTPATAGGRRRAAAERALEPLAVPAAELREVHRVPAHAAWFRFQAIHALERQHLPEYFTGLPDNPRTPALYKDYRNAVVNLFRQNPTQKLGLSVCRQVEPNDFGAIQRIYNFLNNWGIINYTAPGAPLPAHPRVLADAPAGDVRMGAGRADGDASAQAVRDRLFAFEAGSVPGSAAEAAKVAGIGGPLPVSLVARRHAWGQAVEEPAPGAALQFKCNVCESPCDPCRYHCTRLPDWDLCGPCYLGGRFPSGVTSADFICLEGPPPTPTPSSWTNQETLLLLEALEMYNDNWQQVAEHVGTKRAHQCLTHFLQLPIEDPFLEAMETHPPGHLPGMSVPQPTASTTTAGAASAAEDASALSDTAEGGASASTVLGPALPDGALPFADSGNPVMAQVAFLAAMVGPGVAAAAAQAAIGALLGEAEGAAADPGEAAALQGLAAALHPAAPAAPGGGAAAAGAAAGAPGGGEARSGEPVPAPESAEAAPAGPTDDSAATAPADSAPPEGPPSLGKVRAAAATALAAAAVKAKQLADEEEKEVQRLVITVLDSQLQKLEMKVRHFEEMEKALAGEREQVERSRQHLFADRVVLQAARHATPAPAAPAPAPASTPAPAPTPTPPTTAPPASAPGGAPQASPAGAPTGGAAGKAPAPAPAPAPGSGAGTPGTSTPSTAARPHMSPMPTPIPFSMPTPGPQSGTAAAQGGAPAALPAHAPAPPPPLPGAGRPAVPMPASLAQSAAPAPPSSAPPAAAPPPPSAPTPAPAMLPEQAPAHLLAAAPAAPMAVDEAAAPGPRAPTPPPP